ncbi:dihydropteroate synthase [Salinispirillum sp. LH 10-3-1]|uniref:Dihydropteroate synthase n=1 Tax=Salinispirillum sp. LH 10-3-1 TaxID=2952525 RepID=A0AB38YHB7_9GAMM
MQITHKDRVLDLSRPRVMGVVNVTPDSFSDGGRFFKPDAARAQVLSMLAAGVDIIDVGGESTRPGAKPVSVQQELDRVLPVVEMVRRETDVWVSVDTSTPQVMQEAAGAGANLINDVRALSRDGALEVAAQLNMPVCLMHMQGRPVDMQNNPQYDDVVAQVIGYLRERCQDALAAGIRSNNILVDPGFGFGKTLAHNLALLRALPLLAKLEYPVLVGMSRKSMLGDITGKPVEQRQAASVAAALMAALRGAHIIRVHDVAETVDALAVLHAIEQGMGEE